MGVACVLAAMHQVAMHSARKVQQTQRYKTIKAGLTLSASRLSRSVTGLGRLGSGLGQLSSAAVPTKSAHSTSGLSRISEEDSPELRPHGSLNGAAAAQQELSRRLGSLKEADNGVHDLL